VAARSDGVVLARGSKDLLHGNGRNMGSLQRRLESLLNKEKEKERAT
jgi:hypothetical protein